MRGGVILPIWQSEALWLNFSGGLYAPQLPVAIKVAAGKINAVTGETWSAPLNRSPQDYMVWPEQPWLDGFAIEKEIIRQFVAMPLGDGYSVEEQLIGDAEWGGVQNLGHPDAQGGVGSAEDCCLFGSDPFDALRVSL